MNQNQTRNKIELLKEEVRSTLQNDALVYKRAIIRELDYLWQSYRNKYGTIEKFADYVFNFLKVPQQFRNSIVNELKDTQTQIAQVWDDYFNNEVIKQRAKSRELNINYEKLIAAYSVDFPSIDKNIRDTVVKEIRQSVHKNYNFETIRTNLQKTTIGTSEIYTLANTAVSQFDNASMFEFALQAGINKFLYEGVLQPNSRLFCIEHFHKVYTYEQILEMDNGQGVPVVTSCGGYNCGHYWTAAEDGLLTDETDKKKKVIAASAAAMARANKIKLKQHEIDIADMLEAYDYNVRFNKRSEVEGEKSHDSFVNDLRAEFKRITDETKTEWRRTRDHYSDSVKQGAEYLVLKIEKEDYNVDEIKKGLKAAYTWDTAEKIDEVLIMLPNNTILKINRKELFNE